MKMERDDADEMLLHSIVVMNINLKEIRDELSKIRRLMELR